MATLTSQLSPGAPQKELQRHITPTNDPAQDPKPPITHLEDQSSRLPPSRLILVCASLILAIFLTSLEQTSVSTALPTISRALGNEADRAWIGTAFLIGNTASQTIFGRLSDVFGRKPMHLWGLGIFFVGSLLCGFSRSMAQLIAFRGIAGIGGGGIIVCVMSIMNDLVSLKNRGKLQGVVGIGTIVANGIGPTFGGIFAQVGWRWIFWVVCPPTALAFIQCWLWLPLKPVKGDRKTQFKQIDYLGCFFQLGAVIFILIPVSGGGTSFPWRSKEAILFLVFGILFLLAFILVEAKHAVLPIVPLRVFKNSSVSLLFLATFCTGAYFFSATYYLPVYFQSIKGQSPILSSAYLQALILTQVVIIFATGFFLAWFGHYNPILWAGYGIYLIGAGLKTRFVASTSNSYIIGTLILEGFGMGLTLQTSLVALQALVPHEDRAVITSIRNTARFIGGSFGLAISSGLLNSSTSKSGNSNTGGGKLDDGQMVAQQRGLTKIWWFLMVIGVLVLLAGIPVRDVGLEEGKKEGRGSESVFFAEASGGELELSGNNERGEDERVIEQV